MPRTNKKKQRGAERRQRQTGGAAAAAGLTITAKSIPAATAHCYRPDRDSGADDDEPPSHVYSEPAQERPIPDMTAIQRPDQMKRRLFAVPPRRRSATARRFVEAYGLLDTVYESLLTREGEERPISDLVADDAYMRACASLLRAMTLTDFRVGVWTVLRDMPCPTCWTRITELRPVDSGNDVQLSNVGAKEFVVLLAAAVRLYLTNHGMGRIAAQIVHELRAHAEGGYAWLDWTDLDEITAPLTESDVRFTLASAGIKATRRLYRSGDDPQMRRMFGRVRSGVLLDSIEAFANDQVKYRPGCAVGYFNLAWVAQQSVKQRGVNGLAASADCLAMMTKCHQVADAEDDDFMRAAGRIDAAACLTLGAGGIVGTAGGNVVVRDMRSDERRAADCEPSSGVARYTFAVGADAPEIRAALLENEERRMADGVPPTTLEAGEKVVVAPWDVRRLWNEAMEFYDSLTRWGHEHVVYGETWGWDHVDHFVKTSRHLPPAQFAPVVPTEPGFAAEKDKGFAHTLKTDCACCGKSGGRSNKQCGRCKAVYYCSVECQTKHWREGGHKLKCKKA